jgi:hypothetical protein
MRDILRVDNRIYGERSKKLQREGGYEVFDKINELRTDYLRELSGLAKIFITISNAMLGLTLAPFGSNVFAKLGLSWLFFTWFALALTAIAGFLQIVFFSGRLKMQADLLWVDHLTETVVQLGGSDEKIDKLWNQGDHVKRRYDCQYKLCVALIVFQGVAPSLAFVFLAIFMWSNFKAKWPY